jgi:hypothetical protein
VPDHHISPKREKIQAATIRSALVFRTEAQSWERPESPIMFAAKDLRGVEKAGSD